MLSRTEQTNNFSATLEGLTTTLDTARSVGAQAICQNKWRATYSTLLYKCATVSRLLFPDPYIPALNIQAHPLIILELTVNAALLSNAYSGHTRVHCQRIMDSVADRFANVM